MNRRFQVTVSLPNGDHTWADHWCNDFHDAAAYGLDYATQCAGKMGQPTRLIRIEETTPSPDGKHQNTY